MALPAEPEAPLAELPALPLEPPVELPALPPVLPALPPLALPLEPPLEDPPADFPAVGLLGVPLCSLLELPQAAAQTDAAATDQTIPLR